MVDAALGLGSNLGNRSANLVGAVRAIAALEGVEVVAVSSIWETAPWGNEAQPDFLNACILLDTALCAGALLDACLLIERANGRERTVRWGARTLDLDVLFHGETECETATLTLPHPRMTERGFVLAPLAEIVPGKVIAGQTVATHLCRIQPATRMSASVFPAWR